MSQITIANLTFAYDGSYDNIFERVSFQFDTNWRLGFTGRNGRGKTTFLRLLLGELDAGGTISAGTAFSYFPFSVPEEERLTLEILAEICPRAEEWELLRETGLLELEAEALYRPFRTLSGGEKSKALLAALFLRENNFLLIDEPTNHLDLPARAAVGRYLRSKRGFLLVSHDRALLDECTDHTLSVNRADMEIVAGNFSVWWEQKRLRDEYELAQNEKLRRDVKRLTATAREKSDWSDRLEATKIGGHAGDRGRVGHLAAKMMKRSKAVEHRAEAAAEEKSQLLQNIESADELKIHPLPCPAGRLLELKDVSLYYGGKQVCGPVRLEVREGDRLALRGKNGSGKTSLLRLLCGEEIAYTGSMLRAPRLTISYVPQDTGGLRGSLRDYAAGFGIDESLFKAILRKLDFSRTQFEKDMADYSAGQKKKVLLARSLSQQAHLYIWDEPLNYVDILSRMQLEDLIRTYRPTMVFVEHDRAFCEGIATGTIAL
ncbi:MAG: ABC-F type ribosomal protection protein [Oscillospiraceae bacterium]|jgi:lincosamide and streptogramin A transport system ATP-binding/permease protein|nr:ABC-F type ribosomal protection protein [Oscillospiraceae bacterium]